MNVLSRHARQVIKDHGITVREYISHVSGGPDASWSGDVCGCLDDRCANGYHHDGLEDCGCLPVLLREMLSSG